MPLAGALRGFIHAQGWRCFGFARLDDHARERFGRSGRWARDLRALADALDALAGLEAALTGDDGGKPIGKAAALLVGRVATAASLADWIRLARGATVRELKAAVREARAAASSSAPASVPEAERRLPSGAASDDPTDARVRQDCAETTPDPSDGTGDKKLVALPVPPAVRAAFDETLDLYRAIEGRELSATSFVESLVAEACSGPHPADASERPIRGGHTAARVEVAMAESTRRWSHLDQDHRGEPPGRLLSRLVDLERRAGHGGATELDGQVRELLALEESFEKQLGALLARMSEQRAWLHLHFAGVGHYAEERLGLSRTQAQLRARVVRQLRERPALGAAYEDGRLGLEAAAVVLRLLRRAPSDPELEAAWVQQATGVTVKRLRDECRALGRTLSCPGTETAYRHASDTSGEEVGQAGSDLGPVADARSSDLRNRLESMPAGPAPLSDADWMASLRRDRGTSLRRLRAFATHALSSPVASEMLRLRLPAGLADDFLSAVEAARRSLAVDAGSARCSFEIAEAEPGKAPLAARLCSSQSQPVPTWLGLLGLLEQFVITWDTDSGNRRPSREAVYARDGWRCMAPGCSSRRNLEDHHLVYRSHGGDDDESNRICLCRFHHRQGEHGVLATCRGEAPLGIVWTLGRDAVGGTYRNERVTRA
jgi:hypothetical protein